MRQIKTNKKYIMICSVIFAIFLVIGYSFQNKGSFVYITKSPLLSILSIVVIAITLNLIIDALLELLKIFSKMKFKDTKFNRFFGKHIFIISLFTMLVGWSVYIIAFYPTIMTVDALNQLKQFFGLENYYTDSVVLLSPNVLITNHHPVIHTLLLGGTLKLGRMLFGNDNLGLFVYTIIQGGVLILSLAYSLSYLKKQKVKNRFLYILLGIYTFIGVFPFYAMTATKDVLYTAFIILFIIEIHKLLVNDSKMNSYQCIWIFILSILISLMRNNGIVIVIPVLLFFLIQNKQNRKKILGILTLFLVITIAYLKLILPAFNISQISKREVLSIPFQQTARYAVKYTTEVTQEERKIINKVLDYDKIRRNYLPNFSDPVKETFNKESTKEDLKDYFNVWRKQFLKHPMVYIEATTSNIYGYFYPSLSEEYIYYKDLNQPLLKFIANYGYKNYKEQFMDWHFNSLNKLRHKLIKISKKQQYLPIVNSAINNWIIFLIVGYLISKKRNKELILLLPSIMTIFICILSPVNNCFRYEMPIIFSNLMILLLVYCKEKK